jgi:AraC-like DNA-binding protein
MQTTAPTTPRGILRTGPAESPFKLGRRMPSADVAEFVEHFWTVQWDLRGREPQLQETLPHPSVHLTIETDRSRIMGVVRRRFSITLADEGFAFGIKFRPGAFEPFLGAAVSSIADRELPLEAVFGAEGTALDAAIRAVDDTDERADRAEAFLRARLPAPDENRLLARQLVERVLEDRSILRVEDLVQHTGMSVRTLQRLFSRYVGATPKWVIQRYRLHEAAERLASGQDVAGPSLAYDLGYCDQAHFINDFRAIVGVSPAEYARRSAAARCPRGTAPITPPATDAR